MFSVFNVKLVFDGSFIRGFSKGFKEEFKTFSDVEIIDCDYSRSLLNECMPPSKWFTKKAYDSALRYAKKRDYLSAIKSLDSGTIDKTEFCVIVFKTIFVKVAQGCPKLLSEALPTTFM